MDAREPTRLTPPEPSGMMLAGPNSYTPTLQSNPVMIPTSAGPMQGMRLSFNTVTSSSPSRPADPPGMLFHGDAAPGLRPSGELSMSEPMKKKRGRPRKYGPDGSMSLALTTPLSSPSGYPTNQSSDHSAKKRGRPLGSGKKQQLDALGSSGTSFTPHVITVNAGEDVASKIMAFSQQGPRTVCILSANGVICNVSLRQPATSGGTVTHEGRFEIISLSGSFLLTEDGGTRSRTGGLSVALADADGRVLGGGVAGMLVAAAPVQVVMASFVAEGKKPKSNLIKHDSSLAPPQTSGLGEGPSAGSPPSQGTVSESSGNGDAGSPMNHSAGNHNSSHHVQNMSPYASLGWPQPVNLHRHDTDMNMMPN